MPPSGSIDQHSSPLSHCIPVTNAIARSTTGHIRRSRLSSPVASVWNHTPVAMYALTLVSRRRSSTRSAR